MATDPVFIGTPKAYVAQANNSTAVQYAVTASANGERFEDIVLYNDHTGSVIVNLIVNNGTTDYTIAQKTITTKATWNPLQELFGAAEKQFIVLQSGYKLGFNVTTTVANNVNMVAWGGTF